MNRAEQILKKFKSVNEATKRAEDLDLSRKAQSFARSVVIKKKDISDLDSLPRYSSKEVYGFEMSDQSAPESTDFKKKIQDQFFILTGVQGGGEYLVDTQGYNYARYTAKLK